jgi:low affinity Fe/Cu permease
MGKGSIDPDSPAALAKSAIGREERRSLIAVDPDRALRIGGCHGKRHSALADRHSNSDHHPVAAVPGLTTADGRQMNKWLFRASEFLSAPPGFYVLLLAMAACTALVPLGWTDVVTYALSVLAIVITGIVLIQGYRDTTALHAKMDEIIIALRPETTWLAWSIVIRRKSLASSRIWRSRQLKATMVLRGRPRHRLL